MPAVRASVRPAPPAACLCLREAGAGARCGFVTPATSREELLILARVGTGALYSNDEGMSGRMADGRMMDD